MYNRLRKSENTRAARLQEATYEAAEARQGAWVRDPWNSYSVRSYTPDAGFGSWTWLQGILATTPKLAGCPNGDLYVAGKDNWNGIWTRRYSASLMAWQPWQFAGGIVDGAPAVACGSDNAAYIVVRDAFNNMWLARVLGETGSSWHYGAGLWDDDLQIVANANSIHVAGRSSSAPWFRTWEVGVGWQGNWSSPGGVLSQMAAATYGGYLYLTGLDASGNLWWWSGLTNQWTSFGPRNVAAGSQLAGAAR